MGRTGGKRGPRHDGRGAGGLSRLEGVHPVLEALRAGRRKIDRLLLDIPARRDPSAAVARVIEAASERGVRIERVAPGELRNDSREGEEGGAHRVALDAGPLPSVSIEEVARVGESPRRVVVLDGVEDPQNLGAIARVAEASGVTGLIVARRRAAPLSAAASRASAGALEWLPVAVVPNLVRSINYLKEHDFWVLAAEAEAPSSIYAMPDRLLTGDLVVVLGAEGRGLKPLTRAAVDHLVSIPMAGRVASLNVSTAGAVLLFELLRRGWAARD